MKGVKPASKRAAHWMLRWRKWLKPFVSKHGSPEAIARGVAIGMVVAFSPTIGIQLVLAYFIATLCKASRAAALIPVWITMPMTIPPIYAFTYTIGRWFVGGPSVSEVRRQLIRLVRRMDGYDAFDLPAKLRLAMEIGQEVLVPMFIGGLLVGFACAAIAYPLVVWGVRRFRAFRNRTRADRRRRFHFRLKRPHLPRTPAPEI